MNKNMATASLVMSNFLVISLLFVIMQAPARADKTSIVSTILPEVTNFVELSSSDINRIVCSGPINDLIYSAEKGIEGHFVENNAFVKFKITKRGDKLLYAEKPIELFVICDDAVYSFIAKPKRIPAVTLRLSRNTNISIKTNISRFQALPLEKRILQLIRETWAGDFPDGYRVSTSDTIMNISADLKVELLRTVDVEGIGLRINEFKAKTTVLDKTLQLNEKYFLHPDMGEDIVAIALEHHSLAPGESTRLFIVEQRGANL